MAPQSSPLRSAARRQLLAEAAPLGDPHQALDLVGGVRHAPRPVPHARRPAGIEAPHAGHHVVDVVARREVGVEGDPVGPHVRVVEADLLVEGAPADVPLHHVGELLRRALLVQPGVGELGAGGHAPLAPAVDQLLQPVPPLQLLVVRPPGLDPALPVAVRVGRPVGPRVLRPVDLPARVVGVVEVRQGPLLVVHQGHQVDAVGQRLPLQDVQHGLQPLVQQVPGVQAGDHLSPVHPCSPLASAAPATGPPCGRVGRTVYSTLIVRHLRSRAGPGAAAGRETHGRRQWGHRGQRRAHGRLERHHPQADDSETP